MAIGDIPIAKEDSVRHKLGKCPSPEQARPGLSKTAVVFVLVLGTYLATATRGYAQTPSGAAANQPHRRKLPSLEEQLKRYTEVLSLDSAQQAKVKAILDRRQLQLSRVFKDEALSAVDRFHAIQTLHEQSDDQIRKILNPEQASKFEELRPRKQPKDQGQKSN
jgi:Spy/CpxP family protein refolding chaperone